MTSMSGKVALVTGGSVGTELARGFLKAGGNVAFVYRNPARESFIDKTFADFSDVFIHVRADLDDSRQAATAASTVKERLGGIDFLLNSLGGWIGGKKLHEHSADDMHKMLSIDLIPTFNIMSAVLPLMLEQKFGRIVNFISMQVFGAGAGSSLYAASKSAVLALSKAAAEEYKASGISVFAVAPSVIDTPANRKSMSGGSEGKWVKMEDIVDAALFLCGAPDSLNGTVLKFPGRL